MFDLSLPAASVATAYPEHPQARPGMLDRLASRLSSPLVRRARVWRAQRASIVASTNALGPSRKAMTNDELRAEAGEVRVSLRREGFNQATVARAFALIREAATRTVGQRHHDVQLIGGWVMLNGAVAEMETGEGKTLTATLAAGAAALAGIPVHVITVNDYLTARDAELTAPVYAMLGLRVGVVIHGKDPTVRRIGSSTASRSRAG